MSDYSKFRGKCKEMSEALAEENPTLTVVRGYYYCPIWNRKEQHYWCVDENSGKIIDPTKDQFPSKGLGDYEEFYGIVRCEVCGKTKREEDCIGAGNYALCSDKCYGKLVECIRHWC